MKIKAIYLNLIGVLSRLKLSQFENDTNFIEDANYVHTDNNFSNNDKDKLDELENYDDSEIKQDISNLETNKADRAEIPDVSQFITRLVNDLANYYLKSETYTKTEVNNLIGQIQTAHFEVVQTRPQIGQPNVIYLVPKEPKDNDIYEEWIYINSSWELIGSTQIDLTGYATETWVNLQIRDFLTETQVTTLIANALTNYYTQTQIDTLLEGKQPVGDYIEEETDPTVPAHVKSITQSDINYWNGKADSNEIPTDLSDLNNDVGFITNDFFNCNIPRIEARSFEGDFGNIIRLFFKGVTPEFRQLVEVKGGVQIHLLKYAKAQQRHFYDNNGERYKRNEKKWTHPANELCRGAEAVSKQCWGVRSLLLQVLAHEEYDEVDFNDYIDGAEYSVFNNGVVPSEFEVTTQLLDAGYMDIDLDDIMSCILVNKQHNLGEDLDFLISEGSGQPIKIIGCKQSHRCPIMIQPIQYRFAVPYLENEHTKKLYGNSNTINLRCASVRIENDELGMGSNKTSRILPDVGYGVSIN